MEEDRESVSPGERSCLLLSTAHPLGQRVSNHMQRRGVVLSFNEET